MSAALILCLALVSLEGANAFGCCRRNSAPQPTLINPFKIAARRPPPAANTIAIPPTPVTNTVKIHAKAKHQPKTKHTVVEKKVVVKPMHQTVEKVKFCRLQKVKSKMYKFLLKLYSS
jgi:hypothetical protein